MHQSLHNKSMFFLKIFDVMLLLKEHHQKYWNFLQVNKINVLVTLINKLSLKRSLNMYQRLEYQNNQSLLNSYGQVGDQILLIV